MKLLFPVAAAIALSGCIIVSDVDVPGPGYDGGRGVERLYAASVEPGGVRIRVASNGCTTEDSFDVDVNRAGPPGERRFWVRFERENRDRCEAVLPDGVELFFTNGRLGLPGDGQISIANPIGR
jgi:hypothetical protein